MNKFKNIKKTIDNVIFDSTKEAERYLELKMLLKAGKIRNLFLQPSFVLQEGFTDNQGKKHRPILYIADFSYWKVDEPALKIVEDVKGMKTEKYRIKKKLLLYTHRNIKFIES